MVSKLARERFDGVTVDLQKGVRVGVEELSVPQRLLAGSGIARSAASVVGGL